MYRSFPYAELILTITQVAMFQRMVTAGNRTPDPVTTLTGSDTNWISCPINGCQD